MYFKVKGSLAFSCVGLLLLFFTLLFFAQELYVNQKKGQLRLKNFYLAQSLANFSLKDYDQKDVNTHLRLFKEGKVELKKVRDRLKITVFFEEDSFVFMEEIDNTPKE